MGASKKLDEHFQYLKLPKPLQAAPVEPDKDGEGTLHPDTSESAMTGDGVASQDGVATHEDWRELARRVQQERDPNKMIKLVQELISKFDEDHLQKSLRRPSQANSRPPSQTK